MYASRKCGAREQAADNRRWHAGVAGYLPHPAEAARTYDVHAWRLFHGPGWLNFLEITSRGEAEMLVPELLMVMAEDRRHHW
jgi:hypothetical protein